MESVSLIMIAIGAVIIGIVILLRWRMWRRDMDENPMVSHSAADARNESQEFDPLFAVDTKISGFSDDALASVGTIVAEQDDERTSGERDNHNQGDQQRQTPEPRSYTPGRRAPRVAEDPHHVVVLNVVAGMNRKFSGRMVRKALENCGFEYGEWHIFHFYSPQHGDAPPLFSLANMVKPGNFNLEHMDEMSTAGLSLFMVPPGEEDDIVNFDTMLAKTRQLADILGGEVRDARRSVLTRQAIGQIREQLNEWRCKSQVALH